MDEIQINGGDSLGDAFYEKIEAPKFVDLTAPDHHRPDNDDRYWFCLRVGCDQKHEEEMDSEAIYKNFVLRVMAARSPNVRLRKALYGKDPSANLKCPLTVPAKCSKSRVSRLALVSSISQKMVEGKLKGRPLFKQCETPKKKENQSSVVVSKALTTPRNKKSLPNLGAFRSVRNQKPPALAVPKSRMVAKALVFHSPKKAVRINLKKSTELSVRKLCTGMKKLEITSGKKDISGCKKPLPVDSSRNRFRGREVKSRVFDSLLPKSCQGKETKPSKCGKKKDEEKELQLHCVPASCEDSENDSSDMEIEEKSRNGYLEKCSTSGTSEGEKGNEHKECLENKKNLEFQLDENKGEAIADTSSSDGPSLENCKEKNTGDSNIADTQDQNRESNKTSEESDRATEQVKSSQEKGIVPIDIETDENENVSVSDDKENGGEVTNVDDKENALASNDNSDGPSLENCREKNTGDSNIANTQDQNGESNKTSEESDRATEQVKSSKEKGIVPIDIETDENENVSVSDDKENGTVTNVDDKENALASNDNRTPNPNTSHMVKKKVFGKHETSKGSRTVTKGMTKTPKGNSIASINHAEGASSRKSKLTNPKPFRLRTDERQILKEANMEKKLHLEPLKETTTKKIRHNAVQRNEKCLEQTEYASDACDSGEKESGRRTRMIQPKRRGTSCPQTSKEAEERKESTTPQASRRVFSQEKVAKKSQESLKRMKSLRMKQIARTRGIEPSKKKTLTPTTPGRLGVIKESSPTILRTKAMAKPMENATSPATKDSTSSASRPSFLGRKPTTIPKEPHFHNIHVPKSCTRRVA